MSSQTKGSVLITGCSDGGIGSFLAIVFQRRGYHVYATARSPSKMTALQDVPNVTLLRLDVTNPSQIASVVEAVRKETGGRLDYLVNNAGVGRFMPVMEEDIDAAKEHFESNVWGPLRLTQALIPLLMEAKGMIAFTGSMAGHTIVPFCATYCASKRAQEMFASTLRAELKPFGVSVLTTVTGLVKSQGQNEAKFGDWKLPEGSLYKPIEDKILQQAVGNDGLKRMETMTYAEDVVGQILRKREGTYWAGAMAGMVWWMEKFCPAWLFDMGLMAQSGLGELAKYKKSQ